MKKKVFLLSLVVVLILSSVALAGVFTLTSGVAVSDACFRDVNASKTLTLTNSGTTSYLIQEDGGTDIVTISVTDDTEKWVASHPFNKIEVTATGGSGVAMILRCYR